MPEVKPATARPMVAAQPPRPSSVIHTSRLVLRPLELADRAAFCRVVRLNREHVGRWLPFGNGSEPSAYFEHELTATAEGDRTGSALRRYAFCRQTHRLLGGFHLQPITRGLTWEADAVWWVSRDAVRSGYGTEGVRALLRHAFAPVPAGLGLAAVHAGIEPENDACAGMAVRAGFVHVPGQRSHLKVGDRWAPHEFYIARPD